jgi:hypothetical protein
MANELMAKSHHECFSAMSKLLVDARVQREAGNERRRGRRKKKTPSASGFFLFCCSF